ncbi:cytochrome b561 [Agrobacterium tumefaciens]|jgi:cytochrome b561|uniref:Cytochrome b561 n=1 Tax=Agrobacterium tumefaciens str. Kerr 14 TaxID=1183424 RepID=A0A1S7QMR1_AGRTU|nr:hypothetical protein At12D1_11050 [Agrobacterium tumefaciens]MBP2533594.1 cytochrome b561 [Agrobacterium tumefaciens]MDP9871819.1 cytochrome b561 [Agrobacterium tumefaciens]MDP9976460.1 cytochrome b561 [Agrobacterium tumefaciens]CUX39340.1 Cytochrome b561 [Agrobacterium tumefaciens str. Kerr 14]
MGLITMTERDLQRIETLSKVIAGRMTMVSASHVLDLSERQVRRLLEWSAFSRKPQPVDGEGPVSRFAARAAHVALLFLTLTLAVPRAGWAVASTAPLQIPSYVFDLVVVPGLPLAISDQAEAFWTEVHATLAYLAVAIVFLHVTAALWHHFIRKDSTLRRMLPSPAAANNRRKTVSSRK